MNALLLLIQANEDGQIQELARTFGVDWPHLFAQIISFSIVCALLYLFAHKPVLKMLAERRQLIAQGLANTEKIKAELAKTESQRKEVLAQANLQATRFMEDTRETAARLREQERQKAINEAAQIITKAHEAAVLDRKQMSIELKREVGRLVVRTTAAVTGKVLTAEDQRRLAEETTKELTT
jgi:F-type H+-transporting ATPase subunit b